MTNDAGNGPNGRFRGPEEEVNKMFRTRYVLPCAFALMMIVGAQSPVVARDLTAGAEKPDQTFWLTIRDTTLPDLFEMFLKRYPKSVHRREAEQKLKALRQNDQPDAMEQARQLIKNPHGSKSVVRSVAAPASASAPRTRAPALAAPVLAPTPSAATAVAPVVSSAATAAPAAALAPSAANPAAVEMSAPAPLSAPTPLSAPSVPAAATAVAPVVSPPAAAAPAATPVQTRAKTGSAAVKISAPAPVTARVATPPAPDASVADTPANDAATDPDEKVTMETIVLLQHHLNRVGCTVGKVDGKWGAKTSRSADRFARTIDRDLVTQTPNYELLRVLKESEDGVCAPAYKGKPSYKKYRKVRTKPAVRRGQTTKRASYRKKTRKKKVSRLKKASVSSKTVHRTKVKKVRRAKKKVKVATQSYRKKKVTRVRKPKKVHVVRRKAKSSGVSGDPFNDAIRSVGATAGGGGWH